ncbi:MAG TPA: hypothetical protein ENJ17_00195 [Gammaproteobacteria bacterium]|nr:hypothetical protein [Gammaproteobacteria bacterium]
MDRAHVNDFIKRVVRQYLRLQETDLPDDFLLWHLCTECGHAGRERLYRSEMRWLPAGVFRLLFCRAPAIIGRCERCGSSRLLPMHDVATREHYLTQMTCSTTTTAQ